MDVAPDIPLLANLGAIYLNYCYGLEECERVVDMIGADALILYLNPIRKVFQRTGSINFRGLVDRAYLFEPQRAGDSQGGGFWPFFQSGSIAQRRRIKYSGCGWSS